MNYFFIILGGTVGVLLRYAIYSLLMHAPLPVRTGYILPTLLVNMLGSLIIGIIYCILSKRIEPSILWTHFFLTGLLGGFTTFSTFSLDSMRLMQAGLYWVACSYCMVSVTACIALTWIGYMVTAKLIA